MNFEGTTKYNSARIGVFPYSPTEFLWSRPVINSQKSMHISFLTRS